MRRLLSFAAIAAALAGVAVGAPAASTTPAGADARRSTLTAQANPDAGSGEFVVARLRGDRPLALRARPGGRLIATVGPWTWFGSPLVLSVVEQRGDWVAVLSAAVGNGRVGWARAARLRFSTTNVSLQLDLSRRMLVLKEGMRVVDRMTVGVGRRSSPTPTGRFAVTDKLPGSWYGAYYGCCIVALTATQPRLPAGWRGGNRVGIHGTNSPGSIGYASSAGCARASASDMRVLMRRVPLGAPVFIHR